MTVLERKARFVKAFLEDEIDEEMLSRLEAFFDQLANREPCLFTPSELRERALKAEKEFASGGGTPHENIKRKNAI